MKPGISPFFGQKRVLKWKIIKKNSNNLKITHKITKNTKKNKKIKSDRKSVTCNLKTGQKKENYQKK